MTKAYIQIRRRPYEEPYHTQLEVAASNGAFSGFTDIYCGVKELGEIGRALRGFPKKIGDEYRYQYGSEDPSDRCYRYFVLRAYTVGPSGHCALQVIMNTNQKEPDEGICRFSIQAEPASVNRLGEAFEKFEELKHLELRWTPSAVELFDEYQN